MQLALSWQTAHLTLQLSFNATLVWHEEKDSPEMHYTSPVNSSMATNKIPDVTTMVIED